VPSRGVRQWPAVDHEAVVDLGELLCLVILLLVVVVGPATFRRWPSLVKVAPKHDARLEGVLDGPLMIGARLLEHLVEEIGASGRFPRVLVLSGGDKVRVGGVAFRLRLLLAFLLGAALSGRLGDIFRLVALGLLVLPEEERADDIRVGDVGQLGALLRESSDVVPERLSQLLAAAAEIPGVPRVHVRALEVAGEGLNQVVPVGDLPRRQVLQPGSSGVGEEQGEVADDEVVIVRST
jgi:hypothetical protein